ncbi:hypothetical protein KAI87_09550, partial [Myxococcota bacterium]|nr:hypothetical protein [Myxococcota bacterium]
MMLELRPDLTHDLITDSDLKGDDFSQMTSSKTPQELQTLADLASLRIALLGESVLDIGQFWFFSEKEVRHYIRLI